MYNNNQIQNNQALVPYRHALHSNYLPVLDPYEQEIFNNIIADNEIDSHLHMIASTNSGKTELIKLIFIRIALKSESSIVIFDPHGDLAMQCAKMLRGKKDMIYIDPTLKKGLTPTINPFRLKKK